METIGNRVTRLREQRGLSMIQLAQLVRIGKATISHIENDRRKPSIELAIRLAKEFDVSLDELLGKDQPTPITQPEPV